MLVGLARDVSPALSEPCAPEGSRGIANTLRLEQRAADPLEARDGLEVTQRCMVIWLFLSVTREDPL